MEKTCSKHKLNFVKVTVEDAHGAQIQFSADEFIMTHVMHTEDFTGTPLQRQIVSHEWIPEFQRVKSNPVIISTPEAPVDIPAPKYVPAMGDAAQAYCDELVADGTYYEKFRWHDVWKRMWGAREK